ncbi:FAD-dependent oxidoreductase [Pseudorhodoferax soli]|uniref:FAD dependent oxidoreductase n=1 Tax=Pseudorhodoferax soli TaxID=545864 RepID=A0A368Y4P8_9BURK|nr:FAD-dependent oxidoreductase [Pseudorhodoferax soli]RCW73807.1 FAD dependent oxidoreductase [Pseudorhodoferax soli]
MRPAIKAALQASARAVVSGGALPAFAYEAESSAVFAAMDAAGATPNARRKITLNRMVQRLKACGAWSKLRGLWLLSADSQAQALVNFRNPGTNDLTVAGSPTFVLQRGMTFPAISAFLNTGITLGTLSQDNVSMGCYTSATFEVDAASFNMGTSDGSANAGLQLLSAADKTPSFGAMSAVTAGLVSDGGGMHAVNRLSAAEAQGWHMSRKTDTLASTSVPGGSISAPITIGKINGRTTPSAQRITAAFVGEGMTDQQMQILYAAVWDCCDKIRDGDIEVHEPGFAPAVVTADHIVYSLAPGALAYAIQCARDGESVVLVGGWRETQPGGMSAHGLGRTDYIAFSQLGGLAKTMTTKVRELFGRPNNASDFRPVDYTRMLRMMLDGARDGGLTIPIYLSGGVVSATKSGDKVTSITTRDGRTFVGKYFHDGGYEGDLLAVAGVSTVTGREAAGTGLEALSGYRGAQGNGKWSASPYVTPDVPGSGLLPGIYPANLKTLGQADEDIQSYNFRLTTTITNTRRLPLTTTPPANYDASQYEIHARWLASGQPTTFNDVILEFNLGSSSGQPANIFDLNNQGVGTTDWVGGAKANAYVYATTLAGREASWKAHEDYLRGFLYWLGYSGDSRIPTAFSSRMRTHGWDMYHYLDPHPNDQLHWPSQLYVREMRRMVGDFVFDANDTAMTDGTAPRSLKTIGVFSYPLDSHAVRRVVDTSQTPHGISTEGGFGTATGGTDQAYPFPYEAAVPKAADAANVSASFCVSATHAAFGSTRMELHSVMIGQAMAVASRLARTSGEAALQSVDYAALRTALLAVQDATPPNLKQVN